MHADRRFGSNVVGCQVQVNGCTLSSASCPRCSFILAAVCHVRVTTSPTRPIACESEDIMEIAPMSWRMSSAAMVSARYGLEHVARHVIGRQLIQEVRVQSASDDVASSIRPALPRGCGSRRTPRPRRCSCPGGGKPRARVTPTVLATSRGGA